jgi:hypothetical protein
MDFKLNFVKFRTTWIPLVDLESIGCSQQARNNSPELPQKFPQHFPRKVAPKQRPLRHFPVLESGKYVANKNHCGMFRDFIFHGIVENTVDPSG